MLFYLKFYQELFIISKGPITSTNKILVVIFTLLMDGGLVTESCPTLATPWTVALQAPLSMGFPRQKYGSELPFPSPGDLPDPGIKPRAPTLQVDSLPAEPPGKPTSLQHGPQFAPDSRICLQWRRPGFDFWVGKIPWRRKWKPSPVFLSRESHGERSLAGYSP